MHLLPMIAVAWVAARPVHAAGAVLVGQQTVAPTLDSNSAGMAEAFKATASASGTITSLSAYVDPTSKATKLVVGLYADNGGTPGSLLTSTKDTVW